MTNDVDRIVTQASDSCLAFQLSPFVELKQNLSAAFSRTVLFRPLSQAFSDSSNGIGNTHLK